MGNVAGFVRGLTVDLFAGAGGTSTGVTWALGRPVDVAVNHDPIAMEVHQLNHPETLHIVGDVWDHRPRDVARGRRVDLLLASPACQYYSRARGGKPYPSLKAGKGQRGLAWVVTRWAAEVRPQIVIVEQVEEFLGWGPLLEDGRPDPERRGQTFRRWVSKLEAAGYVVEWRTLRASDFGAPTSRRRLFIVARCDGEPIVWPSPTHGPGLLPYKTAAEVIDWDLPCPSIFERRKPLAAATMARIARGLRKFVIDAPEPFLVGQQGHALIHLSNGERPGQAPRIYDLTQPLGTVVAGGIKQGLVTAWLAKHYGGNGTPGIDLRTPLSTVTCRDHHSLVAAFLQRYNGTGEGQELAMPLGTLTTRDRYALVTVRGEQFRILDIGMRMLTPRELARAQGFRDDYDIGSGFSKSTQVRLIGNSVAPPVAEALARANAPAGMLKPAA